MKKKISCSIEKEVLKKLDDILEKNRRFRNRSHAIEEAIYRLSEEMNDEK